MTFIMFALFASHAHTTAYVWQTLSNCRWDEFLFLFFFNIDSALAVQFFLIVLSQQRNKKKINKQKVVGNLLSSTYAQFANNTQYFLSVTQPELASVICCDLCEELFQHDTIYCWPNKRAKS